MNFYNSAQIEETVNQLRLIQTQIDVDRKNKHIVHQFGLKNLIYTINYYMIIIFIKLYFY